MLGHSLTKRKYVPCPVPPTSCST